MVTRLGVVLVHHRAPELVRARIAALRDDDLAIVVVDNSGDLGDRDVGVEVIDPGENLGFGAACNRAVATLPTGVETVCFVNPDVDVNGDALRSLACRLEAQRLAAIAPALATGGRIRYRGFHQPSLVRELVVARRAAHLASAQPSCVSPRMRRHRGRGRRFASAACLVVARDAFDAVGGFDERYFLYAEDLDLWARLERVGACGFDASVVVTHAGAAGSDASPVRRELLRRLGIQLFAQLHAREGWRPWRAVHRLVPLRVDDRDAELAVSIERCWERDRTPAETLAAVRPVLARRGATPATVGTAPV